MFTLSALFTVIGLCVFETVSSIDNAIINAQVLSTMGAKARRWFLVWGILIAVFLVRGLLPLLIVWAVLPSLGPLGAITATFSGDATALEAIEHAAPVLLMGGGIFLLLLFLHWLFLEDKTYGLLGERFIHRQGVWFYAFASLLLLGTVGLAIRIDPMVAFAAVVGSTVFFITHGFKEQAEAQERSLMSGDSGRSDISKILYLEAIDATFSIDGVLGAFAFTLVLPLILIGSGLGAIVVRQLTVHNIERIGRYAYLKNGAMYSILFLGAFMVADGFGLHIPSWWSPLITIIVVGYFFWRSRHELRFAGT